jgi:uncharacterized protein YjiS (DUF1127 family)
LTLIDEAEPHSHLDDECFVYKILRIEMFTRARTLLADFFILAGRARACNSLLTLNDRLLEDIGISRELLQQGVSAWPWRVDYKETSYSTHAKKNPNIYSLVNEQEQQTQQAMDDVIVHDEDVNSNHPIAA